MYLSHNYYCILVRLLYSHHYQDFRLLSRPDSAALSTALGFRFRLCSCRGLPVGQNWHTTSICPFWERYPSHWPYHAPRHLAWQLLSTIYGNLSDPYGCHGCTNYRRLLVSHEPSWPQNACYGIRIHDCLRQFRRHYWSFRFPQQVWTRLQDWVHDLLGYGCLGHCFGGYIRTTDSARKESKP
jgi:hypothetical protein